MAVGSGEPPPLPTFYTEGIYPLFAYNKVHEVYKLLLLLTVEVAVNGNSVE